MFSPHVATEELRGTVGFTGGRSRRFGAGEGGGRGSIARATIDASADRVLALRDRLR